VGSRVVSIARGLVGEVIGRIERKGFLIVGMKMLRLTEEFVRAHYAAHEGKEFYEPLVRYSISGPVTLNGREDDVVLCSNTSDGFMARTLGDWVINVEAEGSGSGTFPAEFYVAAPEEYNAELGDDNFRTDDRFRGRGTVAIAVKGKDQLGLDLVEVEFNASGLESGGGIVIDVQGKLACSAM